MFRTLALVCCILFTASALALAEEAPDEVRLRDGSAATGRVVEVDKNTVILKTPAGVREFKRKEVRSILFEAAAANTGGGVTPGFTALGGLKVTRVTTLRRITNNEVGGDGKLEPGMAKISADGSKIVFTTATGLLTINPDGTGQAIAMPASDPDMQGVRENLLELSADGKYIYFQNAQSGPIYRLNSDGSAKKMLVRGGAEYTPIYLREGGQRIYFGARAFIASIDTEGKGDYREILSPAKITKMLKVPEDGSGKNFLTEFAVSEDGTRLAFLAWDMSTNTRQLYAMNMDGSGLRQLVKTDYLPEYMQFTPDGQKLVFCKHETAWHSVNWDGTDFKKLPLPHVSHNSGPYHVHNRFSPDGQWFAYFPSNDGPAGPIVTRLDGSERFEPYNRVGFEGIEQMALTTWALPIDFNASLTRFVFIRTHGPKQLIVGDINPPSAEGVPVLSDIEASLTLSTNPQLPTHVGAVKTKTAPATGKLLRVACMFNPLIVPRPKAPGGWDWAGGWYALRDGRYLNDEGKSGDKTAGDGIFSNETLTPDPADYKLEPGRYSFRLQAHDERNAVIVDVDGIEIKP